MRTLTCYCLSIVFASMTVLAQSGSSSGSSSGGSTGGGGIISVGPPASLPSPISPLKNDCNAATFDVSLAPYRSEVDYPYKFAVPAIKHGESFTVNCQDITVLDHQSFKSGIISTKCDDGNLSKPVQTCENDEVRINCSLVTRSQMNKKQLSALYSKQSEANALLKDLPDSEEAQPNIIEVIPFCKAIKDENNTRVTDLKVASKAGFQLDFNAIPACTSASKDMCYLDPSKLVSSATTLEYVSEPTESSPVRADGTSIESRIFIWNKNLDKPGKIEVNQVNFFYQERIGKIWQPEKKATLGSVEIETPPSEPTSCKLTVSGTTSAYSPTEPPSVNTTNDVLVFTTNLIGGDGVVKASSATVTYSGGPKPTGVWDNAPPGVPSTVTANVKTASGKEFSCKLTVIPQAKAAALRLRGFGDCNYFNALRSYYFMNSSNSGYENNPKPLRIPGLNAIYGQRSPEVPFKGIANVVAGLNGEIVVNPNGTFLTPPVDRRAFSRAVIVARRLESKGDVGSSNVIFYGLIDPNDYSVVQLYKVPGVVEDLNDSVVFQAYLAGNQPSGLKDLRGTSDPSALQYYQFAPAASYGTPFDRIIPFVNESCVPVFQISAPARTDKPLPSELKGVTQCMFSRPFKMSDVTSGRVDLTLVYMVPEHAHHQFPTELKKASNPPSCKSKNPSNQASCWQVHMKSFGAAANSNPFISHLSCRTESTVMVDQTVTSTERTCWNSGCNNSCSTVKTSKTVKVPQTVITYKPSCPVIEQKNECSDNLAIRFSGYNMQMIAALGCAAKYNRAGELVVATLLNQGVLPYTPTLGGSSPLLFNQYPSAYGQQYGYSCVPCRFQRDAIRAGHDLAQDTAPLPVDQDYSSQRKPIFSFNKSKAPADCVREVEFEVRYFGSQACNGVSNPPGHFCRSSNLGGQSCPSNSEGGGNVAGKFKIPVCPNSGFETDSLSVSWSPIILDVYGNGIHISRDPSLAVAFDIKGYNKKTLVDWPVNTKEVAFLVLPNKKGEVNSIRELFGDYKAKNGFELLKRYDTNQDKIINLKDKIYPMLRLWFDRNRNGVAEPGELELLADNGVDSIILDYSKQVTRGLEGQTLYSVFYNSRYKQYYNVGDFYFNGYGDLK